VGKRASGIFLVGSEKSWGERAFFTEKDRLAPTNWRAGAAAGQAARAFMMLRRRRRKEVLGAGMSAWVVGPGFKFSLNRELGDATILLFRDPRFLAVFYWSAFTLSLF
jgi:hypothetical protein